MFGAESELKTVDKGIFCIEASENPLSADVGIVYADDGVWIFDVGSNDNACKIINGLEGSKRIVLSHFHADHTDNLSRINRVPVYGGDFTCKKFQIGDSVTKDMYFDKVHLFPIPSTHAKGCIGLEFGDYAFLGDAVYSAQKEGKIVYNAGLLLETVKALKRLNAGKFLLSHSKPFVQTKERVIEKLERIYSYREKNNPYIFIDDILDNG